MDKIHNPPSFITIGERSAQFNMLLHVQEFSSMAVLVCGEAQTGKTYFLQAAQAHLAGHHQVASIDALISSNKDLIIESLAEVLICQSSDTAIAQSLNTLKENNESIYLFIDDAHLLEKEALDYLLSLCIGDSVLHLALAGHDGLQDTLNEVQNQHGQDSFYHLIFLAALTEEESNQFVGEVYTQAGFEILPLSSQKMHQLYLLSKGVPGLLVNLIETEESEKEKMLQRFPLGHVAAILLIGTALSFSYFYQDNNELINNEDAIAKLLDEKTRAKSDNVLISNQDLKKQKPQVKMVSPKSTALSTSELTVASALKKNEKVPNKSDATSLVKAKKIAVSKSANAKTKVATTVVTKKQHKLLAVSSKSYALQLLGVRSEKSAQEFIRRFSRQLDNSKLSVYQTQYKGQPWYVVVYGPFGNKVDANKEASLLSKSLKNRPWIRPLSQIQSDIKKK